VAAQQFQAASDRLRGVNLVFGVQQNFLNRQADIGIIFDEQNSWHGLESLLMRWRHKLHGQPRPQLPNFGASPAATALVHSCGN